ncbi:RidA family protein [Phytohabitans kaempferiae]|uniref:RidA family protein n=1 Tax=Phytohabitans kaempferiae TaxID=1620943 RepID=A0ABV6MH94_9ACTN
MAGKAVVPEGFYSHPSFSAGVLVQGGRTLYVAGQLPLSPGGELVAPGDIDGQVERVWQQIEAILAAAGGSLPDIVRVTAYTVDNAYVGAIVAARQRRFAGFTPPASALVTVAGLAKPGALVEIDAVAVLP